MSPELPSSYVGDRETAIPFKVDFEAGLSVLSWVGSSRILPLVDSDQTFILRVYEGDTIPNDSPIYELTQTINAEYLYQSNGRGRYLFSYDATDHLMLFPGKYWLSIQGALDNSFFWDFDPEMFGLEATSASRIPAINQTWQNST